MMFELKPLTCQNCGGLIDRSTMKCPYCDTQYERKYEGAAINYMVERPGVHKVRAMVKIDDALACRKPEIANRYAMDKLRHGIADGILEYLKIYTEKDMMNMCEIIRGEVRVIDPTFTDY